MKDKQVSFCCSNECCKYNNIISNNCSLNTVYLNDLGSCVYFRMRERDYTYDKHFNKIPLKKE